MAGITTSPQLRESPETANFQTGAGGSCAAAARHTARNMEIILLMDSLIVTQAWDRICLLTGAVMPTISAHGITRQDPRGTTHRFRQLGAAARAGNPVLLRGHCRSGGRHRFFGERAHCYARPGGHRYVCIFRTAGAVAAGADRRCGAAAIPAVGAYLDDCAVGPGPDPRAVRHRAGDLRVVGAAVARHGAIVPKGLTSGPRRAIV